MQFIYFARNLIIIGFEYPDVCLDIKSHWMRFMCCACCLVMISISLSGSIDLIFERHVSSYLASVVRRGVYLSPPPPLFRQKAISHSRTQNPAFWFHFKKIFPLLDYYSGFTLQFEIQLTPLFVT